MAVADAGHLTRRKPRSVGSAPGNVFNHCGPLSRLSTGDRAGQSWTAVLPVRLANCKAHCQGVRRDRAPLPLWRFPRPPTGTTTSTPAGPVRQRRRVPSRFHRWARSYLLELHDEAVAVRVSDGFLKDQTEIRIGDATWLRLGKCSLTIVSYNGGDRSTL